MEMTTDEQPLPPSFQAVNKMPTSESHLHMASPPAPTTPGSSLSFAAGPSTQRSRANTSTDVPPQTPTNARRQSRAESASSATGNGRARNTRASPDDGEPSDDSPGKRKKKKGQKFFCTGYGECNLSFTRSEHLARHIRYEANDPQTLV